MNRNELLEKINFMEDSLGKGFEFALCLSHGYNFKTLESYLVESKAVIGTKSFVILESIDLKDSKFKINSIRHLYKCKCNAENWDTNECNCEVISLEDAKEIYLDEIIKKIEIRIKSK